MTVEYATTKHWLVPGIWVCHAILGSRVLLSRWGWTQERAAERAWHAVLAHPADLALLARLEQLSQQDVRRA